MSQIIDPQDLIDAIESLTPGSVGYLPLPAPGVGPETLLAWAEAESAALSGVPDARDRGLFNTAVLAKAAVECLIDWYLCRRCLQTCLRPRAGAIEKMAALGGGVHLAGAPGLIRDLIFTPRDEAVHRYSRVDQFAVSRALDLAKLVVRAQMAADAPVRRPVFFGEALIHEGRDALPYLEANARSRVEASLDKGHGYCLLRGFGAPGSVSVLFDSSTPAGRVILIAVGQSPTHLDLRVAPIRDFLSATQLNEIFDHLCSSAPVEITGVTPTRRTHVEVIVECILAIPGVV